MGKAGKERRSQLRKAAKKRRKSANYLRYGPKQDYQGRRQKRQRYNSFKPKKRTTPRGDPLTPPGVKARRRRLGLAQKKDNKGNKHYAKLPLRPLRKRRHIVTTA